MFLHPWYLLFLLFVPFIAWLHLKSFRDHSVTFSSVAETWDVSPTIRSRLMWLPSALLLCSLALMIVAMARPRYGREQTIINSEGIAIEMVVDRSSSMQALDFKIEGSHVDRLQAIKNVASKFVLGDGEDSGDALSGRPGDLVGLMVFAGYADALTPPTLDHEFLIAHLNETEIVDQRSEDGTAIGDAIALGVDKLSSLDDRQSEKIKSKIMILLTDGENTAGRVDPLQAAELAKAMEIKIYTIGVGTNGLAPYPIGRARDGRIMVENVEVRIDEETLQNISSETGGKYFRATDTNSLEAIYDEIDLLEKTKVETQKFTDYREIAVQPWRAGGIAMPPLLLVCLLMLAARHFLMHTMLREVG